VATNSGVLQYLKGCVYVRLGINLCFIWHLPDHYQVYDVFSYIRNTVWSWAVSINFIWNMPLTWNPAAKWFSMLHSSIKFHKASTIWLSGFQRLTVSRAGQRGYIWLATMICLYINLGVICRVKKVCIVCFMPSTSGFKILIIKRDSADDLSVSNYTKLVYCWTPFQGFLFPQSKFMYISQSC